MPRTTAEIRRLALITAAAAMILLGAAPASASVDAQVTADPSSISVGGSTTITATGLGGLEQASFGLGDTAAGQFTESGSSSYTAPATGGTATATFTGLVAGTVTIAVGDGETVLGTVDVTITAGGGSGGDAVQVSADPAALTVGESTTVTASGLGGLETASFGLGDTAAGTFAPGGQSSAEADVSDGTATVTFTPTQSGTVTIAVGDGETVLGETTVTVTEATSPTPTSTPTPTPAPADGISSLMILIIVVGVLLVGAIVLLVVLLARRRKGTTT